MTVLCITSCDGITGSSIANHLAKLDSHKFKQIRMLCENKSEAHDHLKVADVKNFDIYEVSLTDKDSLCKAFYGVDFTVIIPPVRHDKWQVTHSMLHAAQEAKVSDAILLSWTGTHADVTESDTVELNKFKQLEDEFMSSKVKIQRKAIVRANFLIENLLTYASTMVHDGILPLAMGEGKVAPLDSESLGEAMAKLCANHPLDPKYSGQTMTFTGPKALSGTDFAATITSVLGKEVIYKNINLDQARSALQTTKPKLDNTEIQALLDSYKLIQRGIMDHTSDDLEKLNVKHPSLDESIHRLKPLIIKLAGSSQETSEQQKVVSST